LLKNIFLGKTGVLVYYIKQNLSSLYSESK